MKKGEGKVKKIFIVFTIICFAFCGILPVTVLVEQNAQEALVYVHSMISVFESDNKFSKQQWWDTIKTGFDQKGQEF